MAMVIVHLYFSSDNNNTPILPNTGGISHFAVQVYGDEEWSFRFCEQGTGVFSCAAGRNPNYSSPKSVPLGQTVCSIAKVNEILEELCGEWPGRSYDLSSKNSNHFCTVFIERLGVPIPTGQRSPPSVESNGPAFRYHDLYSATNQLSECLGDGGFGAVYKGSFLFQGEKKDIAVKQMLTLRAKDHGIRDFLTEVVILRMVDDPNVIKLIGYCTEDNMRMLVYELMPLRSLFANLYDPKITEKKTLDWNTRMKIATGVANGLEYLHNKANPPVILNDLKTANILLDDDFNAKIGDFGLAKLCPADGLICVSPNSRSGTKGYVAPEFKSTGQMTVQCDIYAFGVVLLELITGEKALCHKTTIVEWFRPSFKDGVEYLEMADQKLEGSDMMVQVIAVAAMCVERQPKLRPPIAEVCLVLKYIASHIH